MTSEYFLSNAILGQAGAHYHAGKLEETSQFAAMGLGLESLTPEMVREILNDIEKLTIFLELARLYVDPQKTLANKTINPRKTLFLLEETAKVLQLAHQNNEVLEVLNKTKDERLLALKPELIRDRSKVASAVAPLDPIYAKRIRSYARSLLRAILKQTPEGHITKPLLEIEIELLSGVIDVSPDFRIIDKSFDELLKQKDQNPHRVATVACWVSSWANRFSMDVLESKANRAFNEIVERHPELGRIRREEWMKRIVEGKRNWIYSLFPWSLEQKKRIHSLVELATDGNVTRKK